MNKIELTKEQKKCVEFPLDKQALVIDADPGTGKTEILRHRVKFIHQQNQRKRKFILILAVGRNISKSIKRKLKEEGLKKIHDKLRSVLSEFSHKPCEETDYLLRECLERKNPVILSCTVHSIAYWIVRQIFAKALQEKKKIQILTGAYKKELSMLYMREDSPNFKEKIHWTTSEIITRKRRIFNHLINQVIGEKMSKETKRDFWKFFREEIKIDRENIPYYYWNVTNYSAFLTRVKNDLGENNSTLYEELVKVCQENQVKNVWLSFDDIIENVLLFAKKSDNRINWPNFDYILVDECQDLQIKLLILITQIFSYSKTKFTFVGDPKQNIMAFAGATEDIFKLLEERFPDCEQLEISVSFRVPQEIAAMANDFTSKFMPYKPKLTTNRTNGEKKPVVFLAGKEKDYHLLTVEEEKEMERKFQAILAEKNYSGLPAATQEKKVQKLWDKLTNEKIKAKKLQSQVEFILGQISRLDKLSSRVILYRKNEIGNWLKNWFIETNYYDFIMVGDNQNRAISYIINKIKKELKDKPLLLSKVKSIESFLTVLGINWRKIPRFQQIVEQFDQERLFDEERTEESLTEEDANEFIRQIDEQLTEKDIENTGKTILSTIHKAKGLEFDYVFVIGIDEGILPSKTKGQETYWVREEVNLFYTAITRTKKELYLTASCQEECSRFVKCLNPNFIEILPVGLRLEVDRKMGFHESPSKSVAELIGEKGEEKVWKILTDNEKIKTVKIVKNYQEIEDLQIDVFLETQEEIYFVEVKDWSENFYYSIQQNRFYRQKILKQQVYHWEKVKQNFLSSKKIIYLITFPTGELASDFQDFLVKEGIEWLTVTHHDEIHSKTWEMEYGIKRIDELIIEKRKK